MRRRLRWAAVLCSGFAGIVLYAQQAPVPAASVNDLAIADLREHHPADALALLEKAIAENPNDATSNLLAASSAIELGRADLAVQYGESARALDPQSWKIHTTLVTAYAIAGKTRERDAERVTLRTLHASGSGEAAQASGFLLDEFKVRQYAVDAVEYFSPVGKFHICYRFILRNAEGKRVWQIDVQSDDFNQASWAKAYPKQAAEGQRQFQLTGEGNGTRSDYRSFSGSPDYDWIKARVIDIVQAQTAPFPGEAAAGPG